MTNNGQINMDKGLAVIGLAIACVAWMYFSGGISGIGWFIVGLFIIF